MKVAYFIGSLNRGGTETLVLDTFRHREALPYDPVLIYRNDGNLSEDYRSTGVPMIRIKPRGFKPAYVFRLRSALKREKVDILHTQTLLNAFLGLFCVAFTRIRLVASFHGLHTSLRMRVFAHLVIWFADASVFVSEYVRKWYLQHTLLASGKRCHVVYNGIDWSKLDQDRPAPDFLGPAETTGGPSDVKLAMVGSFVGGRSQRFVCQSLARLRDNGMDNFQFFFVGRRSEAESERYDECVRFCEGHGLMDKVHFLGERKDVPAILQHIDGFVYASVHDTFGIAVVEAIAAGVPVVVNDWEVMKDITDNGRWAILYKTGDVDSCAKVLAELLADPARFKAPAQEHASEIRNRFGIERHIRGLSDVYGTVCRG